jgi:hypothetical protein
MNILNYARQLELVNYSKVNENTLNEADADPAKALEQVKSGKVAGSTYAPQWKQVQDAVVKGHEAGQVTGTVKVLHDNQSEMVTVTWTIANGKVTVSLVAAPAATIGQNISIDKLATYDPKGKMNEFVAALITVSIEKIGTAWTKAHIDWVTSQINKCKALGGFYGTIANRATGKFLVGDGDVFTTWVSPLRGGDRPTQIDSISKTNKNAGSAATDQQVTMILQTINTKLQEDFIGETDENAIHGLFMLISPKYTTGQLTRMYEAIRGTTGGVLSDMSTRGATDDINTTYKQPFIQWCVGVRGNTYESGIYTRYGFDINSYTASVAAIKTALV